MHGLVCYSQDARDELPSILAALDRYLPLSDQCLLRWGEGRTCLGGFELEAKSEPLLSVVRVLWLVPAAQFPLRINAGFALAGCLRQVPMKTAPYADGAPFAESRDSKHTVSSWIADGHVPKVGWQDDLSVSPRVHGIASWSRLRCGFGGSTLNSIAV